METVTTTRNGDSMSNNNMRTLRYVIRQGWLEAFESTLTDTPLGKSGEEDAEKFDNSNGALSEVFMKPWIECIRVGERRDPLATTQGSFGVFEVVDEHGQVVSRVADASTRFKHLSSKVGLAKWSRVHGTTVCPPSGWLSWDMFELTHEVDMDNLPEGAEFLRGISLLHPWVLKRDGASGGKGVCFVSSLAQVVECVEEGRALEEALPFLDDRRDNIANWAAQEHINRPLLLLGGHKCHLRAYVVSIGPRVFVYQKYEVRIAPHEWQMDFTDLQRHITNGGGAEAHHERRFLADEFPELNDACSRLYDYLCLVTKPPYSEETTELDPSYVPAAVMGLDIMVDMDGRLYMLESNHSPASPPFDEMTRFGRHVRRFVKNLVALLVVCSCDVKFQDTARYGFVELL